MTTIDLIPNLFIKTDVNFELIGNILSIEKEIDIIKLINSIDGMYVKHKTLHEQMYAFFVPMTLNHETINVEMTKFIEQSLKYIIASGFDYPMILFIDFIDYFAKSHTVDACNELINVCYDLAIMEQQYSIAMIIIRNCRLSKKYAPIDIHKQEILFERSEYTTNDVYYPEYDFKCEKHIRNMRKNINTNFESMILLYEEYLAIKDDMISLEIIVEFIYELHCKCNLYDNTSNTDVFFRILSLWQNECYKRSLRSGFYSSNFIKDIFLDYYRLNYNLQDASPDYFNVLPEDYYQTIKEQFELYKPDDYVGPEL
jgi:hypothetical protein